MKNSENNIALRLFIPLGFSYFISVLLGSANAIMSPVLVGSFSLSPADLGFMTSVYLVAFGLAQFPGGVFLDRCGARRTLAPAMLLGVAGTALYALAGNMGHLIISRALVGVGMSCCLMGAFKAYAELLPSEKLPVIYSAHSFIGGIGGVVATRPVALVVELAGWRACFWMIAALTLISSLLLWVMLPKDNGTAQTQGESFASQLRRMCGFLGDSRFWLVAPIITAAQGMMFAYQYLWVCPWLRDVAGLRDAETGIYMMYAGAGTAAGYLLNGFIADRLSKRGWLSWEGLYLLSGSLLTLLLTFMAFDNSADSAILWSVVMFLATMTMVSFPILRKLYPAGEVGRAFSLLNFMIFFTSFLLQWLIGALLNLYPALGGHFSAQGHQLCMGLMAALNLAAVVHFCFSWKKHKAAGVI